MKCKTIIFAGLALAASVFPFSDARAGEYCREYNRQVMVGGRWVDAYGTACLRPDGSWEIVAEDFDRREHQYNAEPAAYYDRTPAPWYVRSYTRPAFVLEISDAPRQRDFRFRDRRRHDDRNCHEDDRRHGGRHRGGQRHW